MNGIPLQPNVNVIGDADKFALPCDVLIGAVRFPEGTKLVTLVAAATRWHDIATGKLDRFKSGQPVRENRGDEKLFHAAIATVCANFDYLPPVKIAEVLEAAAAAVRRHNHLPAAG